MSQINNISLQRAYTSMAIAIVCWGVSTSFIQLGLNYFKPFLFLFLRFAIAAALLTPFALIYRRHQISQLIKSKWAWFIGLSESFGLISQYLGQQEKYGVPAGLAALLSLMFLIIVPFISPFVVGEKLKKFHFLPMIIGILGIYLIASEGDPTRLIGGSAIGIALLVGAAFCYAIYIVTTSRLTTIEIKDVDTFSLFYLVLVFISITSFIPSIIFNGIQLSNNIDGYLWLSLLIIFSTLIAFFAYFEALKRISANSASVLLLLQVLFPFAIDYIFLAKRYSSFVLLGSLFVIIAMILVVTEPLFNIRRELDKNETIVTSASIK